MSRPTFRLRTSLALVLLLAAPLTARAGIRLVASPPEARAGDVIEFRWSGLPESVEEVELEYALAGGRWTRLSPELEGEEREYRWRTPRDVAGEVRVRLRHGRRHHEEVGAETTLRLVVDAHRSPAQGVRSHDAWDLDRPLRGPVGVAWGRTHDAWSVARALPAIAGGGAVDAPEPFSPDARAAVVRAAAHVPRASHRAFESRRILPLRN